jgi:hypothetical protein
LICILQELELATEEAHRWEAFIDFKRRVDRHTVMSGRSLIRGLNPGHYDLGSMVNFADLPPLEPRHAVIRNCYWIDGDGNKPGILTLPPDFDGAIPEEIATSETVGYYGAAIAETSRKNKVYLGTYSPHSSYIGYNKLKYEVHV